MTPLGIAYLVGAGPGDPGLVTRRAVDCLRCADIVFHDHLANPALLEEASGAERVYVGKEAGAHAMPQEEINARLVDAVRAGRRAVRLKGGDPFVFGRGGEEAIALAQAGLRFEVVPGITSGIAAPACAGIPVTHRGVSTAVTLVTGHEDPCKQRTEVDWRALGALGHTLCIYMGVGRLAEICRELIAGGRPPTEPAALVQEGTLPRQRTVEGTLADLAERAAEAGIRPPALLVVGPVVSLRASCSWFEQRPLHGRAVLITRSRAQAGALASRLALLGAETIEWPTVRIEPVAPEPVDAALAALAAGRYAWAVFTSPNGVEAVWKRLIASGRDARAFAPARIAAIGPGTAAALLAHGLAADLVPEKFVGESLFAALRDRCGESLPRSRFLLLRSDLARETLRELLAGAGAECDEVTAYRTVPVEQADPAMLERLASGRIHLVPFAASSAARSFARLTAPILPALLARPDRPRFVSIGPVTSAACRECGLPVDAEAREFSLDGLVEAVETAGRRD